MQTITTIGLDIAKAVFQVHGVDNDGKVVTRRQLKRRDVLAFFERSLSASLFVAGALAVSFFALEAGFLQRFRRPRADTSVCTDTDALGPAAPTNLHCSIAILWRSNTRSEHVKCSSVRLGRCSTDRWSTRYCAPDKRVSASG